MMTETAVVLSIVAVLAVIGSLAFSGFGETIPLVMIIINIFVLTR